MNTTTQELTEPWQAAEWLVSSDLECRRQGLAALGKRGDWLFTPLVTYLLASRVDEPDLELRGQIVSALAECSAGEGYEAPAPRAIRDYLFRLLAGFDRPQVERLLEVAGGAANGAGLPTSVVTLLDRIPNLSNVLTRIAADRTAPAGTRAAAIAALGELGVIDALPVLEGLKTRIEGQAAGQLAMAFAPASNPDDGLLLEALRDAIDALTDDG